MAEFENLNRQQKMIVIPVPIVKVKPLKREWMQIFGPLVNICNLEVRMNLQIPSIDLRSSDDLSLERGRTFINAILRGFRPVDCLSILKDDDFVITSFRINEVKRLSGSALERAIGRVIGTDGKMKSTIENTTHTKIIIGEHEIDILGNIDDAKNARDAICRLIMGSRPNSIANRLKILSSRQRAAMSTIYSVPYNKN